MNTAQEVNMEKMAFSEETVNILAVVLMEDVRPVAKLVESLAGEQIHLLLT